MFLFLKFVFEKTSAILMGGQKRQVTFFPFIARQNLIFFEVLARYERKICYIILIMNFL